MPAGVPVATVAVGDARNAGLLAVRILAATDPDLQRRMVASSSELRPQRPGEGRGRARRPRAAPDGLLILAARLDRLTGLDLARCLALLGMVATHVLAERTPTGDLAAVQWLAGGRASALFALLAGVGLALATGGRAPVAGRELAARSAGVVVRALLVAAVGLQLGGLDSGLAVILASYGAAFLLAVPFLGWSARRLLLAGGAWVVVGPVLLQLLRPGLAARGVESPDWSFLADPGRLLSELLVTGYYPALAWVAYVLLGLGVGRLDLRGRRVPALLVAVGAAVAVVATVVSSVLVHTAAVSRALLADRPDTRGVDGLLDQVSTGMFGSTPADGSWAWLLVVAPHSSTPLDLAQTAGSAVLVVGLCLLVVAALPAPAGRAVAVLGGAGAATLSLYTLHVWLHTEAVWPADGPEGFRSHVLVLLALGAVLAALGVRGPLEAVVRSCSDAAAAAVRAVLPAPPAPDRV